MNYSKIKHLLLAIIVNCSLSIVHCSTAQPTLMWAKQMGGTSTDHGYSIVVDDSGNVLTTGYFVGTVDFDPGSDTFNMTSAGGAAIFVSKLDLLGNFVWAKQMGGRGYSIAIDGSGNVYTTGYFLWTVDFDPGPGTFNMTSAGSRDIFVSKLDASGNFVWAKQMGGGLADEGYSIAVDSSGNVYTTGYFLFIADFDPGPGTFNMTSAGAEDIFVSKLDASGNFVWAKQMVGTFDDYGFSIAVDGSGNVLTTGTFFGTADFDPGASIFTLTSAGTEEDIFVSKLDGSGNFVWAKQMGGSFNNRGYSIAVDDSGNVYTTGYFRGTSDFDPGPGTYNMTSSGASEDIFVSKLDASGNFVWAIRMGGFWFDYGSSITLDGSANVYVMGNQNTPGNVDFDPDTGVYNLNNTGIAANFIAQYDNSGNFICAFIITPGRNTTFYNHNIAVAGIAFQTISYY